MCKENISQEFRLRNIDETRNYFREEIKQNELMSKKHKKACATLNYIEHFLILASAITKCFSISDFAALIWYSNRNYKFCHCIKSLRKNCGN